MANLRSSMPNPGNKRARRGRSFRCASAGRATPHAARTKPATGLHKPVSKPPAAPTRPPEPTCQLSYGLCNPGNALPSRHMAPEPPPRSIPGRVFHDAEEKNCQVLVLSNELARYYFSADASYKTLVQKLIAHISQPSCANWACIPISLLPYLTKRKTSQP